MGLDMIKYRGRAKTLSVSLSHHYLFKLPRVAGSAEQIQSQKKKKSKFRINLGFKQGKAETKSSSFQCLFAWLQGPCNDA